MVNGDGATEYVGIRIVYRGIPAKMSIGTVKQGGAMDSAVSLNLTYILVELDGQQKLELNKVSPTFRVNGNDMLAAIKALT